MKRLFVLALILISIPSIAQVIQMPSGIGIGPGYGPMQRSTPVPVFRRGLLREFITGSWNLNGSTIDTWYDTSGYFAHSVQTTAIWQPVASTSGAVFNNAEFMVFPAPTFLTATHTWIVKTRMTTDNGYYTILAHSYPGEWWRREPGGIYNLTNNSVSGLNSTTEDVIHVLSYSYVSPGNYTVRYYNNLMSGIVTQASSYNGSGNLDSFGARQSLIEKFVGTIKGIWCWDGGTWDKAQMDSFINIVKGK